MDPVGQSLADQAHEGGSTEWTGFHHKQAQADTQGAGAAPSMADFRQWLSPGAADGATPFVDTGFLNSINGSMSDLSLLPSMHGEVLPPQAKHEGGVGRPKAGKPPAVPVAATSQTQAVPSTAVYLKGIPENTTEADIEAVFLPFLGETSQLLIVPYFERGVAFVDLGSTKAVMSAVHAARVDGIQIQDTHITVEPSKKPVRASGLRAMNVRKRGDGIPPASGKHSQGQRGREPVGVGAFSVPSRDPSPGAVTCWVVQEMSLRDSRSTGSPFPERRIVGVFVQKEQAVAAANTLWAFLKSHTSAVASYSYQEIREDSQNGNFYRRLDNGSGQEVRQVTVEAPSYLNPVGHDLRECTSTFIDAEQPQGMMWRQPPSSLPPHRG